MRQRRITLAELKRRIGPEAYAERVVVAEARADELRAAKEKVDAGRSLQAALKSVLPAVPVSTAKNHLRRYEAGGVPGLINRRVDPQRVVLVTDEVMQVVKGAIAANAGLSSERLVEVVKQATGKDVGASTLRAHLHMEGLSLGQARPRVARKAAPVALAGAELFKAVAELTGAVDALTDAVGRHVETLPEPTSPPHDDRENRDDHGRFLPEYNRPEARTDPKLGAKFDTVDVRRRRKDLRQMRLATSTRRARYRKDLAMVMLPALVEGARWSELRHWQGKHLRELVGVAYRPATLDKHARELKYAGAAEVVRTAAASFWQHREGEVADAASGAIVLYVDAAIKPIWTRQFARSARVSSNGRVMPATSTVWLHNGAGTSLIYRSFSGHVSVPEQAPRLLDEYERMAGEGTARRVMVLDRESHAAWLFKELDAAKRMYIVPLRSSVVGDDALFEDLSDWSAYRADEPDGDQLRDGSLWLNDSRPGEPRVRVRVVARRRHRTGKVAWFATNTPRDQFTSADVIRLYFDRWPLQEHRFREGNGRVGLDVQHGYGKHRINNVAVIDRLEQLNGTIARELAQLSAAERAVVEAEATVAQRTAEIEALRRDAERVGRAMDAAVRSGTTTGRGFATKYRRLRELHAALPKADERRRAATQHLGERLDRAARHRARVDELADERDDLARKTTIFTVDTELDEILTGYKVTFLNLASVFMREFLGTRMEVDTLINGVLSLPGERQRTRTTETIRVFRQPRDADVMAAVQRACDALNQRQIVRDKRILRFELVDPPPS